MMSTRVQRNQRPGTKPRIRQKLEEAKTASLAFETFTEVQTINTTVTTLNTAVIDLDTRVTNLEP